MIQRIRNFQNWVGTVSTATLGVFSGYFINEILLLREYQWFGLLLLIVFIVFFEKTLLFVLKRIICGSVRLRRLIAEHHFVEGYWIERLINPKNPSKPYGYAIVRVKFLDMEYVVSGEIVNEELTDVVANFNSTHAKYNDYTLTYYFKGTNVVDDSQNIVGRGDFEFVLNDKHPIRYRGVMLDTKNHRVLKVEAEKLNQRLVDKYTMAGSSESNTIFLLKEYLQQVEQHHST